MNVVIMDANGTLVSGPFVDEREADIELAHLESVSSEDCPPMFVVTIADAEMKVKANG